MAFHRYLIAEIPNGWNSDQLKGELEKQLPDFFDEFILVKVIFRVKTSKYFALIGCAHAEIYTLNYHAERTKIFGSSIQFLPDEGDARNDLGEIQTALRTEDEVKGFLPEAFDFDKKKLIIPIPLVGKDSLDLRNLPPCVAENCIAYNNEHLHYSTFGALCEVGDKSATCVLKFASCLDTIQCLFRWNRAIVTSLKPPFEEIDVQLCDPNNQWECNIDLQTGLGHEGRMLDFHLLHFEYQYVPFDKIDDTVLDLEHYHAIPSMCMQCQNPFQILGFDQNLGWVAGQCRCSYDPEDGQPKASALDGERFTRLVLTQDDQNIFQWIPLSEKKII